MQQRMLVCQLHQTKDIHRSHCSNDILIMMVTSYTCQITKSTLFTLYYSDTLPWTPII